MIIKLYENFTDIVEMKDIIFLKAVETYNIEIIEFFIKKGYNVDDYDSFIASCDDIDTFKFFLKKGIDVNEYKTDHKFQRKLYDADIQRALIDFGYENIIEDTVGFNDRLKADPKYADIIQKFRDVEKYNL